MKALSLTTNITAVQNLLFSLSVLHTEKHSCIGIVVKFQVLSCWESKRFILCWEVSSITFWEKLQLSPVSASGAHIYGGGRTNRRECSTTDERANDSTESFWDPQVGSDHGPSLQVSFCRFKKTDVHKTVTCLSIPFILSDRYTGTAHKSPNSRQSVWINGLLARSLQWSHCDQYFRP